MTILWKDGQLTCYSRKLDNILNDELTNTLALVYTQEKTKGSVTITRVEINSKINNRLAISHLQ